MWGNLRRRIVSSRSLRLREKRSDFLMYEVLRRVVDNLFPISAAYRNRLIWFRSRMNEQKHAFHVDGLGEISEIQLELMELQRRMRPLRQVLRHFVEDHSFEVDEDVRVYLDDTRERLVQVQEDIGQLRDVCKSLADEYNRHSDRKMNDTLFLLTVASAIFMPAQFLSGVYGMNFEESDGTAGIPELKGGWKAYVAFWCVTVVWFALSSYAAFRYNRTTNTQFVEEKHEKRGSQRPQIPGGAASKLMPLASLRQMASVGRMSGARDSEAGLSALGSRLFDSSGASPVNGNLESSMAGKPPPMPTSPRARHHQG